MPIYMKYEGIDGEAEVRGRKGWMEIQSFNWSLTRTTAAAKGDIRGDAQFGVTQVTIAREADSISSTLMVEAATGDFSHTVEIVFLRTGPNNKPVVYLSVTLRGAGLASYSINSTGDRPIEMMTLSFSTIEMTSMATGDDLHAVPTTAALDVFAGTRV